MINNLIFLLVILASMLSIQSREGKSKKELSKKQYQNPPTTQSASNSSRNRKFRRKRGVSLSKQHSINFDRIYQEKDLKITNNYDKYTNSKLTINQQSRMRSNSKSKLTIQSVKSEKNLGFGVTKNTNLNERISIGQHEKLNYGRQQEDQVIHTLSYGGSDKKSQKKQLKPKQLTSYGFVRRI